MTREEQEDKELSSRRVIAESERIIRRLDDLTNTLVEYNRMLLRELNDRSTQND